MDDKLKIAIGCDDFSKLKGNKGVYYIDKSLFIKDVINNESEVVLITRPRRFGKTLNMSMLYYYFSIDEDCQDLFKDLKIMQEDKKYTNYLNTIPTTFLTFNGSNWYSDYEGMIQDFKGIFSKLYNTFNYLLDSDKLTIPEKHFFNNVILKQSMKQN